MVKGSRLQSVLLVLLVCIDVVIVLAALKAGLAVAPLYLAAFALLLFLPTLLPLL